jgi:hypothetical protein
MPKRIIPMFFSVLMIISCGGDREDNKQEKTFRDEEDIDILPDDRHLVEFERVTNPTRFLPYDLEEMIGDSAEFYWRYHLISMVRADYKDKEYQNQFVTELFKFPDPNTAFGLYTLIRPDDCEIIKLGTEAFPDSNCIIMLKDRYVSDVSCPFPVPEMKNKLFKLAEAVEVKIPGPSQYPEELSVFPAENKVPYSEAYVHNYFLDQPFFSGVFTCDYNHENGRITVFYAPQGGTQALNSYLSFIRKEGEIRDSAEVSGCRSYAVVDPEFGDICLYAAGEDLLGIINRSPKSLPLETGAKYIKGLRGYRTH